MGSPKAVQALVLFLFMAMVIVGLFFLLSRQLAPLLEEIGGNAAPKDNGMTTAFTPTPPLPATLTAMNQVLAATVVPITVSTTPPSAVTALVSAIRIGIVNSDVVNVRSYPDLAGDIIGQAQQGERLEILATSTDGQWLQICCPLGTKDDNRQSWVAAEFVTVQQAGSEAPGITLSPATDVTPVSAVRLVGTPGNLPSMSSNAVMGTVNESMVNLRSGPGTVYALVGQVQEQSAVTLTGRDAANLWWRICCPPGAPTESWISAEFIDLTMSKTQVLTLVPVVTASATPPATSDAGVP